MATMNRFDCFLQDLGRQVHDLDSDVLKVALTNTVPVATNTVLANITQITAEHGYSDGGASIEPATFAQTSGIAKMVGTSPVFTAAGGTIGPFRYAVLYNSTTSGGPLIGWWDYGASLTLNSTDTFTPTFDGTNGIFTIP